MAELILGPLLRHVGETDATVWVETDAPCEVEVMAHRTDTFGVEGHHYGLVCIEGLEPGSVHEYDLRLDGEPAWPHADSDFPPSTIRTIERDRPLEIVFGSCRVALPHRKPYTLPKDEHDDGREFDALYTLAKELLERPRERWPDLLLLLGDQVYVDEGSPAVREYIRATRDVSKPPGEEVANFEEYTRLYHESWGDPVIRWLLSTVSSAMVIDDHDMHDDWNISRAWREDMEREPWWREREVGGLMTYWIYQHIGNLAPEVLADHELYQRVRGSGDAGPALREFAERDRNEHEGARWSFSRDLGTNRLLVTDDRTGRVLREDRRSIFDEHEWEWILDHARGDFDHFVIGTTDPFLLAPGLHYLEAASEAICDGVWGASAARLGEKARRALDLDHWAAFGKSFDLFTTLLQELGSGRRGGPPATIPILSGDVHHAYLAEVAFRRGSGVRSAVWQAVCSPFRNALDTHEEHMIGFSLSPAGRMIGRALARAAGARDPDIRWRFAEGPFYDNQVATLTLRGRDASLRLEKTVGDPESDRRELELVFERSLT
jgi:PhoD-like phosphatase